MNVRLALCLMLLALEGCAGTQKSSLRVFDFGLAGATAATAAHSVVVPEMRAPEWLDSTDMLYRLAYQDRYALARYGQSRWAGAPGAMLTLRLRQEIGHTPGGKCTLGLELAEFSQVFDAPAASRAVLKVQAALNVSGGSRSALTQREFRLEKATPTADAPGSAAAFSELAGELAVALNAWIDESADCAR
jgi:cholesterol transport system auxiliary component